MFHQAVRRIALAVLAVGLIALTGCAGDDSGAQAPEQPAPEHLDIDIVASGYQPARAKLLVGGTVTWTNRDERGGHTAQTAVTYDPSRPHVENPDFDTHTLTWGEPYTVTFHKPGRYKYYCSFHEMEGEIEVVSRIAPSRR